MKKCAKVCSQLWKYEKVCRVCQSLRIIWLKAEKFCKSILKAKKVYNSISKSRENVQKYTKAEKVEKVCSNLRKWAESWESKKKFTNVNILGHIKYVYENNL